MLTIVSFVFFTALVGVLTWLITRHKETDSADGYFLAGRSLGAGVIAGSLLLTNLSTEQLVGLNGDAYTNGLSVMAWEVVAGVSLVLMAVFFLPRYLRRGITTIPEFLAGRYNDTTQLITNFIFILAYMMILLPIILYTGAMGLKEILAISDLTGIESETATLWLTVWTIGIIGSIYAIFGGLRSVAVSDTLNGFGLLVGGGLIAYFGLSAVGDGSALEGLSTLRETHPEKFNSLGSADSSVPWPTLFSGVLLLNLFYWTTNQQIIQRTFAASTLAEGQKGVLLAATFKILAPLILVLPGIIAFHLYGQGDSPIPQDQAYGTLVRNVLPTSLTGFFAAALVGAILSSFNSALNATATLFSLGFYRKLIRPTASDHETVRMGRIFGTIIALAAMTMAPMLAGQDSIFGYLQKMNGLYFIPIFAVVLVGMLSKKTPAIAANIALVVGVVVIFCGYFAPGFSSVVGQIHEFHFLGIVFVSLVAMMLGFAAIAPRPSHQHSSAGQGSAAKSDLAADQPYAPLQTGSEGLQTDDSSDDEFPPSPIDMTPWPLALPAGITLAIIVVGIYAWFAI
ncbi:putative symporter YidK [Roseimaritima multifibrata]|uniref:Putative symporter YidK n=1 Tax=Roseimaritima multifibrata TaxID=1930274 RepID=A0A517MNH6_9BACT|nr:solute:sodium symporter family transporter [Roseimaritima multifibrata]QDS96435.1 putative symporter YidK [Roseimaritima multifibrata]